MHKFALIALACSAVTLPAYSQDFVKDTLLKHLKTSKDFTVKVAEAMPEADYDFKLTPPQMSFAEQMIHIAQAQDFFLSYLAGEKVGDAKPASKSKADVVVFLKASFDKAIERAEAATRQLPASPWWRLRPSVQAPQANHPDSAAAKLSRGLDIRGPQGHRILQEQDRLIQFPPRRPDRDKQTTAHTSRRQNGRPADRAAQFLRS